MACSLMDFTCLQVEASGGSGVRSGLDYQSFSLHAKRTHEDL